MPKWTTSAAIRAGTEEVFRVGYFTVCAAVLLSSVSCVSTVTPPPPPERPCTVVLARDARHIGLFLPRAGGAYVEYGYGDWDWYAQMDDSWYDVLDTVLLPTQGTLARREVHADDVSALQRRMHWMEMWPIEVELSRAEALLAELDRQFACSAEPPFHNATYRMDFVRHEDSYWFAHNCYDQVSEWLRDLDCSVTPLPIRLGVTVARPEE
jgi:hypothetical protein